jgi:hypothetical protein
MALEVICVTELGGYLCHWTTFNFSHLFLCDWTTLPKPLELLIQAVILKWHWSCFISVRHWVFCFLSNLSFSWNMSAMSKPFCFLSNLPFSWNIHVQTAMFYQFMSAMFMFKQPCSVTQPCSVNNDQTAMFSEEWPNNHFIFSLTKLTK